MSLASNSSTARTAKPGLVLALTSGATFLAFLDTTIVNVAFPALREDFPDAEVTTLSWVVSAYAVMLAALLTPAGRLADVLGRKRLFLSSLAAFTAASLMSALAPNIETLIAARALQGGAAAGMIPAALGLVLFEMPPERRTAAVGIWGATASMAAAIGPSLGGVLVEADSWRAVFLVNVPLGVLLLLGGLRSLPKDRPTEHGLPDFIGTVALTLGIGAVVAGLTEGSGWGWDNWRTISALAGGAILVMIGLLRSRRHPAPAVEIALWRNRVFAMANLTSLLAGLGMFAWLLSGPLFTSTIWNYSILEAGLSVTPGAFTSAVAAIIVGRLLSPRAQRWAVSIGMVFFAITGFWFYAAAEAEPNFVGFWLPAGALGGAALGATMTGLSSAAAMSVPPHRFATGIGLNTTARQVGGALGVAATAIILTENLTALGLLTPEGFQKVFLFCGIASVAAAIAGLGLLERNPTAVPAGAGPAAQPPVAVASEAYRP